MNEKKKRIIRDVIRLFFAILFSFIYTPSIIALLYSKKKGIVWSDLEMKQRGLAVHYPICLSFLYFMHNDRFFRSQFYYRLGPLWSSLISWIRPGDRYFIISKTTKIGRGMYCPHSYATIINADSIGDNFTCRHCTTIGCKHGQRPVIGSNVELGANVTIIGGIHIGNNVVVGAGSVVVKDVPDNSVAAGNPAKIIRSI